MLGQHGVVQGPGVRADGKHAAWFSFSAAGFQAGRAPPRRSLRPPSDVSTSAFSARGQARSGPAPAPLSPSQTVPPGSAEPRVAQPRP